jgi:multidrug resistance efflux pump
MAESVTIATSINHQKIPSVLLQQLIDCQDDTWYTSWLNFLAIYLDYQAAYLLVDEQATGELIAIELRPDNTPYSELLHSAAQQAITDKHAVVSPLDDNNYIAAWPYINNGKVLAIITLILPEQDKTGLEQQLMQLEWCAAWLELRLLRDKAKQDEYALKQQQLLLDGFVTIIEQKSFQATAMAFCNYVSRQLNCERVVLGYELKGNVNVCCQSDSNEYVERLATMRLTKLAMQETLEQQESVCWPAREDRHQVNLAHQNLSSYIGEATVLSVPLVEREVCYGVVLIERGIEQPFSVHERIRAEALANMVGLALEQKRQSQLPLSQLIFNGLRHQLTLMIKPGYLARKVSFIISIFLLIFFSVVKAEYQLAADAVLEGAELRSVVVPFDGFLEHSLVRAGDEIKEGDNIASLDTRELRLQRMKWISEQSRTRRQYEDALSKNDRSNVQIYFAQMERSKAELSLVDFQLEQAQMTSPFDAIVVSGDQSQRIGASVRQGDVLFELAPNDRYRLALFVSEFRINDVIKGQTGQLILAAMSAQYVDFKIKQITPIAQAKEGESVYRVEAEITSDVSLLRPGLEGVAKVYIDERLLISIWTRSLRDWLTMQWWRFWG